MKSRKLLPSLLLLIPLVLLDFQPVKAADPAAVNLIHQMISSTHQIKSLRCKLRKKERVEGVCKETTSRMKITMAPVYQVYMRQEKPKAGMEVLYKKGWNDDKALINTNGFPWVNVSLNPMGSKMREGNHHTILDSGFDLGMDIIDHILFKKYKNMAADMVKIVGSTTFQGADCYQLVLDNQNYKIEQHTVKAGETINSIAKSRMINGYMILSLNGFSDYETTLKPGQVLKVPSDYAKRMIVYIEKDRMIPRFLHVHDDQGLYEQLEYLEVELNPTLTAEEFSPDFPDYGF